MRCILFPQSVALLSVHFISSHTDLLNLDYTALASVRAGAICRARILTQVFWPLQSLLGFAVLPLTVGG